MRKLYLFGSSEDIIGLNDQEKYSLIHGRSLWGDRFIKLAKSMA